MGATRYIAESFLSAISSKCGLGAVLWQGVGCVRSVGKVVECHKMGGGRLIGESMLCKCLGSEGGEGV